MTSSVRCHRSKLINTLLSLILQVAIILGAVHVVLLLVSQKWKGVKPVSHFYGSIITTTLMAVTHFLWRPRLERQGGAQLSLHQLEMEEDEWP